LCSGQTSSFLTRIPFIGWTLINATIDLVDHAIICRAVDADVLALELVPGDVFRQADDVREKELLQGTLGQQMLQTRGSAIGIGCCLGEEDSRSNPVIYSILFM
jgi:hypothetical protein